MLILWQAWSYYTKLKTSVETAAVGSCLSVDGKLGKLVVKILIDTGSAVTLVREDVWKMVQQSPKTTKATVHTVVAANGEKLELVGQGEVSIAIGGVTRRHMVLVMKHLTQECILGGDFLTKHACVVNIPLSLIGNLCSLIIHGLQKMCVL